MLKFQKLVSSSTLLSPSLSSSDSLMSSNLLFGFGASGNILLSFQQVQLSSQLAPAPLPAALVVHLEVFPLRVKNSRQVEKVAVHIVVGPLQKVLKNCLLQAYDVFDVKTPRFGLFQQLRLRVPSLAERVAYLRYSINLRLFN